MAIELPVEGVWITYLYSPARTWVVSPQVFHVSFSRQERVKESPVKGIVSASNPAWALNPSKIKDSNKYFFISFPNINKMISIV